jgi:hypothetical protein
MTRTDQDTWDLASSVGATATWVAAARALASKQPDALIDDPFADPLVRAVGLDFFIGVLDGEITDESGGIDADADPEAQFNIQRMVNMMAVRTRFFDGFFTDATDSGIRQAVILAAGLDSRPYRLSWPAGTVVYEVDQPAVVEFKSTTLSKLGADPTAERRTVAIDLRGDWLNALRQTGFDETRPSAWSAGPADVPAAGGSGPFVRFDHHAQRSGQPACHRIPSRRRACVTRETRQGDGQPLGAIRLRCRRVNSGLPGRANTGGGVFERPRLAGFDDHPR